MMQALFTVAFLAATASAETPRPTRVQWEQGKSADAAKQAAAVDKAKKKAAVGKAVELLTALQAKVMAEGEAEAKTYDKFSCFCKDTSADKAEAIRKGSDDQVALSANINELAARRGELDGTIQESVDGIAGQEARLKAAAAERKATAERFATNSADLKAALDALGGALKTLRASRTPALAQLRSVSRTVERAVLLADTLGLASEVDRKALAFLQREPANENEVPMEDYDFHSEGIIKTLETLLDNFRQEKVELDKAEDASVAAHESLVQEGTDALEALNHKLAGAKRKRESAAAEIGAASQRLSTVSATLLDDKEYAKKLFKMCTDKSKTWEQRSRVRAAELATLTQAIQVIKGIVDDKTSANTIRLVQRGVGLGVAKAVAASPRSMEAIEAAAEAAEEPASLLQVAAAKRLRGSPDGGRSAVVDLLRSRGSSLRSTLLTSLASQIAKDPFAKVKVLIQELIERLLQESNNEANQKGWCDKATKEATQKRDYAAEEVRDANSEMAKLEAVRDALREELSVLAKAVGDIEDAQKQAQEERDAEAAQNKAAVEEAQQGLDALNLCIEQLDKFYRLIAREKVQLSLAQGPVEDAPDAGFDNGEAYTGAQSESGGILAMLDVMKGDFIRTIQETERAEAEAAEDHEEFMTETSKSLATKREAEAAKKEQFSAAEASFGAAEERLHAETEILKTAVKELMELKPVCVDTGMAYAERVGRREDEIASLNKALCVLERYQQYGPDGAGGC